ncbi:histamine N-methyltransferase A-like [Gouania willdenowi]|uniref:Histamine N-methyltransferase A-like n=1 Tax=Gouania willdenowi TaxID=441366 RepID=A0A8C5G0K8_GOUWI|nr:histamine N-methyltransferase A-like [Gouania willdenowi]XP_028291633.1 histamine N-methyltransferase A-like [Gouania willdenowi]
MAGRKKKSTCYEGRYVENFNFYLKHTELDKLISHELDQVLQEQLKSVGANKSSLDVLGVGSGGGEKDVQILSLLQSLFPSTPITTDIVDGSSELINNFKALVAKTDTLQTIPFTWHVMRSEDFELQVKASPDVKKFDFIHMIHVIYYMEDVDETLRFYHSLLKNNGRIMIVLNAAGHGWDSLWTTYKKELQTSDFPVYNSSAHVKTSLENHGFTYEEHIIPSSIDITECFNPNSTTGESLLSFMTETRHFQQSFTPEIRAGILDHLRNKCSTEQDGKLILDKTYTCFFVHA